MFRFFVLLAVPVSLAVWYYNYWAVGCGRCSYSDFWRIGPHTALWLIFIIAMFAVWIFLRQRTKRTFECPECQRHLETVWGYCPDCGARGR